MKKKKGFTLVELLAVIVILAIILVIAIPQIMNVIKDTTKASLESSASNINAGSGINQWRPSTYDNYVYITESYGTCRQSNWLYNNLDYFYNYTLLRFINCCLW